MITTTAATKRPRRPDSQTKDEERHSTILEDAIDKTTTTPNDTRRNDDHNRTNDGTTRHEPECFRWHAFLCTSMQHECAGMRARHRGLRSTSGRGQGPKAHRPGDHRAPTSQQR